MILKKLSLSPEQIDTVKELVSKKVSGRKIAEVLRVPQPIVWRNMELLGMNKKKKAAAPKQEKNEYFDWDDYKGDYYFFTS